MGSATADMPVDLLIEAVDAAEDWYAYVTRDRLRRLTRREPELAPLGRVLARTVERALALEVLLSDRRDRLAADGQVRPIELLRLNRRHPRVLEVLGAPE